MLGTISISVAGDENERTDYNKKWRKRGIYAITFSGDKEFLVVTLRFISDTFVRERIVHFLEH